MSVCIFRLEISSIYRSIYKSVLKDSPTWVSFPLCFIIFLTSTFSNHPITSSPTPFKMHASKIFSITVALFVASAVASPVAEGSLAPRARGCANAGNGKGWYRIVKGDILDDVAADFGAPNTSDKIAADSGIPNKDSIQPVSIYSSCLPSPHIRLCFRAFNTSE